MHSALHMFCTETKEAELHGIKRQKYREHQSPLNKCVTVYTSITYVVCLFQNA
jgi:hypothetical protein